MIGQLVSADNVMPLYLIFAAALIVLAAAMAALTALVYCRIFAKAGFPWAFGLLVLLPVSNFFVPTYLAFADRPVQREYRRLRQNAREGRYGTMGGNEL